MEAYILDKAFQVVSVVDKFSSLIWSDRFNSYGDFEIDVPPSAFELSRFKHDYYLWNSKSEHVMIIEKVSLDTDADNDTLTITGRSLESMLSRRIPWGEVTLSGNFQEAIKKLITDNIISPSIVERKIDNFIFVDSDDPEITKLTIEAAYDPTSSLYDIISKNCEEFNIGFKIVLTADNKFAFSLYTGADRSYSQTDNPYVIFSPSYDNLSNSNYLVDKTEYKNVALVGGEGDWPSKTTVIVGEGSGLDRREIYEDANDISSEDAGGNYQTQLKTRGNEILTENKEKIAFEGEADIFKMFVFGVDFFLGDVVQLSDKYGNEGRSRITEIVFSHDSEGEKTYPTFIFADEENEDGDKEE